VPRSQSLSVRHRANTKNLPIPVGEKDRAVVREPVELVYLLSQLNLFLIQDILKWKFNLLSPISYIYVIDNIFFRRGWLCHNLQYYYFTFTNIFKLGNILFILFSCFKLLTYI